MAPSPPSIVRQAPFPAPLPDGTESRNPEPRSDPAAQANVQIDAEIGKKDHWTNINPFPIRKCGFFAKIKEIQRLCGGDLQVAAQTNVQIDAEIGKKDHFRIGNYIKFRPIASPRRHPPRRRFFGRRPVPVLHLRPLPLFYILSGRKPFFTVDDKVLWTVPDQRVPPDRSRLPSSFLSTSTQPILTN